MCGAVRAPRGVILHPWIWTHWMVKYGAVLQISPNNSAGTGGWLTPLKNMSSSIGRMNIPNCVGKFQIDGNQTTNQSGIDWWI